MAFVAAWALKRHPQIAANLADCEVKLGKYRDAAEHFSFMVRDPNGEAQPEEKQEAQRRLKEVQAKIGTLVITVNVGSAEVLLDGKSVGMSPLQEPVFVEPGSHTIEARKDGYLPSKTTTVVVAASSSPLTINLKSAEQHDERSTGLIIGGAALSAALLGSGIVFTVVSNGKANDADGLSATLKQAGAPRPCQSNADDCASINSRRRSRDTFANAAMGSYIAAGALAIGTVGYGLFAGHGRDSEQSTSAAVRVVPMLTSQQGGVLVVGAW